MLHTQAPVFRHGLPVEGLRGRQMRRGLHSRQPRWAIVFGQRENLPLPDHEPDAVADGVAKRGADAAHEGADRPADG